MKTYVRLERHMGDAEFRSESLPRYPEGKGIAEIPYAGSGRGNQRCRATSSRVG